MSFFPAKIEVGKITYWHIDREEQPSHCWEHHQEYNFAVELYINPRIKAVTKALYLVLLVNNKTVKVNPRISDKLPEIVPTEKLANVPNPKIFNTYVLQLNEPNEVKIPDDGILMMEFNRGKFKRKVKIKLDDEYRLTHWR